jgi:hypothetical protein
MACVATLLSLPSVALVGCESVSVVTEPQVQAVGNPTSSLLDHPNADIINSLVVTCDPCPDGNFNPVEALSGTIFPDEDLATLEWSLSAVGGASHYTRLDNGVSTPVLNEHIFAEGVAGIDLEEHLGFTAPAGLVTLEEIQLRVYARWIWSFLSTQSHAIDFEIRHGATVIQSGSLALAGNITVGGTGAVVTATQVTGLSLTKSEADNLEVRFTSDLPSDAADANPPFNEADKVELREVELILGYQGIP